MALLGCSQSGNYSITVKFPGEGDLRERVERIRVRLLPSCTSSVAVDEKIVYLEKGQTMQPSLGSVDPGRYAIEAVGYDGTGDDACAIARVCELELFEAGGTAIKIIELAELDDPICENTDGGVDRDASTCTRSNETCNDEDDDCDGTVDEVAGGVDNRTSCGMCEISCGENRTCVGGLCVAPIVEITTSAEHTCALRQSGEVFCWGLGTQGQLGNGTFNPSYSPVQVSGLTDAVQIGSGRYHMCARRQGGQVMCWGENMWKQLSTATEAYRNVPTTISGAGNATSIGVGYFHTCVVNDVGGVSCWGWNGRGQLGRAFSADGDVQSAVLPVTGVQNVVEVDGGFSFTCARYSNGTVACWGYNDYGQLGDGTQTHRTTAGLVKLANGTPLNDVIAISLGGEHACALREGATEGEGTVLCWGINSYGGVGNGTVDSPIRNAVPTNVTDAREIATGYLNSCARRRNGRMLCWGFNDAGQLGIGSQNPTSTPTQVSNRTARSLFVDSGDFHTCAVSTDLAVMCWGSNASGQLGTGSTSTAPQTVPIRTSGL